MTLTDQVAEKRRNALFPRTVDKGGELGLNRIEHIINMLRSMEGFFLFLDN